MKLSFEHISKLYGDTAALQQIDLTLGSGVYGLLGPNGAGKTTLMRIMTDLLAPSTGRVLLDGQDIAVMGAAFRKKLGYLPQDFGVYPNFTAEQFLLYIARLKGLSKFEAKRQTDDLLHMVGLEDKKQKKLKGFSGGQRQRVGIAQALLGDPEILVLDEPAAGLDPEGRDDILSEVKEYHKKTGTTVLLVSHSMEDIAKYANRVLVMSNKKIAMYDTVEKVFARAPELLELGLSVPQVTKIFLKLREMGVDVPADVYTIPYAVKPLLEAKRRRDAGESLVLPRSAARKGGAV